MKCCVEGCERAPKKGDHFFRVKPFPERVWVCQEHFAKVEFAPGMKEKHLRFAPFFAKETPQ